MSRELPEKPNLDHLKKQAKALLHESANLKLADAQHAIAKEYGFASWPKLKEHVQALVRRRKPAEALKAAICASDAAKTARVLRSHPELKATLNEPLADYGAGMQAMLAAVQRSDRKTIDVLLQAGADINARSRWWAGGVGVLDECSPTLASFLIDRGAVVDARSAARLGILENLRALLAAAPDEVHVRGANGFTALHYATSVEIAQYLLDHGADIDALDLLHESTPAQHMLRVVQARHFPADRQDIALHLVARGCRTDIFMGAALGDLPLVRGHLDSIAMTVSEKYFPKRDPRSEGSIYVQLFGPDRTPHMIAKDFGHQEVYQFLLEHSPEEVKLAQAFDLGDPAIFSAFLASRPGLVQNLSEADRRRLPDAAQSNNTEAVRLMLEADWPVDAKGEYNLTALGWASWHGNVAMVRDVLKHRPQVDLNDCEFEITALGSALHGSENSWHRETGDYGATVQTLIDAGAKPPKLTDDLEASPAVREVLRRYEESKIKLP
jgi:ankyrin repeat protein